MKNTINEAFLQELNIMKDAELDGLLSMSQKPDYIILSDEAMISSANGTILKVTESYEKSFGFEKDSITGKNVFDLEANGFFNPCITARVIREKKKIVIKQTIHDIHHVMTTGIPIFDKNGELKYAICFNTLSYEEIINIQKKYNLLQDSLKYYADEIQQLEQRKSVVNNLVVRSKAMQDIWETLCYTANTDANIIITGETGVGKSVFANAIHKISARSSGPYVNINCAVIHENLIESELFGYEKGAFTGASLTGKIGKVEISNGGTLFLDEIGELPLQTQSKLLQLIQDRTFERVSGTKKINVDFRLITATNFDLEKAIKEGTFRGDLYYRLNVLNIEIPPLRQRKEDICPLALNFLTNFNKKYNKNLAFSSDIIDFFENYSWPGNVRQLENLIERSTVTCQSSVIELTDLPSNLLPKVSDFKESIKTHIFEIPEGKSLNEIMENYEKKIILTAYEKYKTTVNIAKHLGISQPSAARKLTKYKNKKS